MMLQKINRKAPQIKNEISFDISFFICGAGGD